MSKGAKASRARARDRAAETTGRPDRAERAAIERLRRLEDDLAKAVRAEARRRRQLAEAESDLREVLGRIVELAASVTGPAAEAAGEVAASAHVRLAALSRVAGSGEVAAVVAGHGRPARVGPATRRSLSQARARPRSQQGVAGARASIVGRTDAARRSSRSASAGGRPGARSRLDTMTRPGATAVAALEAEVPDVQPDVPVEVPAPGAPEPAWPEREAPDAEVREPVWPEPGVPDPEVPEPAWPVREAPEAALPGPRGLASEPVDGLAARRFLRPGDPTSG